VRRMRVGVGTHNDGAHRTKALPAHMVPSSNAEHAYAPGGTRRAAHHEHRRWRAHRRAPEGVHAHRRATHPAEGQWHGTHPRAAHPTKGRTTHPAKRGAPDSTKREGRERHHVRLGLGGHGWHAWHGRGHRYRHRWYTHAWDGGWVPHRPRDDLRRRGGQRRARMGSRGRYPW
jgi:hypothetical protein